MYDLTYLITSADKRHLAALDPARLDSAAVARFFDGVSDGFEEVQQAIEDGLILLHRLIAALHDNEVSVIHIGIVALPPQHQRILAGTDGYRLNARPLPEAPYAFGYRGGSGPLMCWAYRRRCGCGAGGSRPEADLLPAAAGRSG